MLKESPSKETVQGKPLRARDSIWPTPKIDQMFHGVPQAIVDEARKELVISLATTGRIDAVNFCPESGEKDTPMSDRAKQVINDQCNVELFELTVKVQCEHCHKYRFSGRVCFHRGLFTLKAKILTQLWKNRFKVSSNNDLNSSRRWRSKKRNQEGVRRHGTAPCQVVRSKPEKALKRTWNKHGRKSILER